MEINTNISAKAIERSVLQQRPAAAKSGTDGASFDNTVALESALKNLPETRSDAVERARTLIGDVHYPPQETIRKISHLLAIELGAAGK